MKIFSTQEINSIRQFTLREQGISERQYIETVAESLALEIITSLIPGHQLMIIAGPDRNGAYALSTARNLCMQGYRPKIFLLNIGGNRLSPDCRAMRDRLVEDCGDELLNELTTYSFSLPEITEPTTMVDGLFGTERTAPLPGGYRTIVEYINYSGARVISLDVPSGLIVDAVEVLVSRFIVHAAVTLAIGVPRVAFFMKENAELLGNWKIVPVDLSQTAINRVHVKYRMVERQDIRSILPQRPLFESKADSGDAIIFAGSSGMLGAAVLSARAALRGGCGKVTIHSPKCAFFVMQTSVPCALFDSDAGDVAIKSIELNRDYNAVAIGPGMGTADATIDALDDFLKIANANSRPLVLDADALNCIAIRPEMLNHIPVMSILTPHAGEFDRLFGRQPSSYARLLKAIEVAERRHIIIILKGRFTAVVRPDGKVYFNSTGTPALATAGTGDVLTGLLVSFMARGMRPEYAALAAPYVHGLAGELAAQVHGTYGVTAQDVVDNIGKAIKTIIE